MAQGVAPIGSRTAMQEPAMDRRAGTADLLSNGSQRPARRLQGLHLRLALLLAALGSIQLAGWVSRRRLGRPVRWVSPTWPRMTLKTRSQLLHQGLRAKGSDRPPAPPAGLLVVLPGCPPW